MKAAHLDYRPDIDGLRAFAVLCVIAFHAFPNSLGGGFIGVDVFFVLSGFLISGIIYRSLQAGRFTYADFYARRIKRIFPALVTVLATCLVVGWFRLAPDEYKELGRQAAAGAGFIANILFWREAGYFDVAAESKPLLHLWSLGIEEQFYFVWPIVLAVVFKYRRHMPLVLCLLLLASFIANVWFITAAPTAVFYLPFTRFWELLLGSALAYATLLRAERPQESTENRPAYLPDLLATGGVILLGAALLLTRSTDAFPGWWALLPTFGTMLLVASPQSWFNRRILSNRAVVLVGLISYPLYLWHWVVLSFLRHLHDGEVGSKPERIAAIALSVLLAWLTYVLIEKPIRFGAHESRKSQKLFAALAVVAVIGVAVDLSDGAASRYPAQIRALAMFSHDREVEVNERAYRVDRCFLDLQDQTFDDLAAECVDRPDGASKLVVLWGDSHAASLYPGLKSLQDSDGGFRIAQFTARACPPVMDMDIQKRSGCRPFDDAALAKISALKPDIVVLEGNWSLYAGFDGLDKLDLQDLQATVERLRAAGVQRVVVFGSLPVWTIYQPRVGIKQWNASHSLSDRSVEYVKPASITKDKEVGVAVASTGAIFISPIGLLCNRAGCLISTKKDAPVPVTWDDGHLTTAGSQLLMRMASNRLFGDVLVRR